MCTRLLLVIVAVVLVCGGARALRPDGEPDPPSMTLLSLMEGHLTGEPVIGVGSEWAPSRWHQPPPVFREGESVISRLQTIASAVSDDRDTFIPFLAGNTWAIAPQTRQEIDTGIGNDSAFMGASRRLLVRYILGNLTPEQVKQLASSDGLPASALSKDLQAVLSAALRPPIDIQRNVTVTTTDAEGRKQESQTTATDRRIREPVPLAGVRLRAHLESGSLPVKLGENGTGFVGGRSREGEDGRPFLYIPESFNATSFFTDVSLPLSSDVPNKYKPSDLDGRAYRQPVGIRGAHGIRKVLEQIGKQTGLRLDCEPPFQRENVFLGREDIACGDVLDALRLALTGGWRRLGDRYILAWDRRGLGAVQQLARESGASLSARVKKLAGDVKMAPAWPEIAMSLPFDPNDPLAFTDDQRSQLFGGPTTDADAEMMIGYDQMTPGQQAAAASAVIGKEMQTVTRQPFSSGKREGTAEDASNSYLLAAATVELDVRFPGEEWAGASTLSGAFVDGVTLRSIRRKAGSKAQEEPPAPAPAAPAATFHPAWSGLMVPALPPTRVADVVAQMKRHGLKTLFYPALFDGYATFATDAFPLSPAVRGVDGLAAAATAARREGVALVAYTGTLSWRLPGDRKHWLDSHPDWLDRDILGRTRLEWLAAHKDFGRPFPEEPFLHTLAARDFVRPGEPSVKTRMERLVDDLARKPGIAGMAFADWRPVTGSTYDATLTVPPLGFAQPERLATLDATGWDPVDAPMEDAPFEARPPFPDLFLTFGGPEKQPDLYRGLVDGLIARARARRKDWTTYRVDAMPEPPRKPGGKKDPSAPDHVLAIPQLRGEAPEIVFVPVPTREDLAASGVSSEVLALKPFEALALIDFATGRRLTNARAIIYDFRACPDDITSALEWLGANAE